MLGVALELPDLQRVAVHIGKKAAGRLAVEACGWHQHVARLLAPRPCTRVELDPVVPALLGRERCQVDTAGSRIECLSPCLGCRTGGFDALVQIAQLLVHASGTDWPACT